MTKQVLFIYLLFIVLYLLGDTLTHVYSTVNEDCHHCATGDISVKKKSWKKNLTPKNGVKCFLTSLLHSFLYSIFTLQ